jgi:hypothetical protein
MIVQWAPPTHYAWLCDKLGCGITSHFRALEAVREDGSIAGMIGFDTWWHNAAQMHFAAESSVAMRKLLPQAFSFVFAQREVVVGWVPASMEILLRMAFRLGFRELCVVREGWKRGDDMIMLELRKKDFEMSSLRVLERN